MNYFRRSPSYKEPARRLRWVGRLIGAGDLADESGSVTIYMLVCGFVVLLLMAGLLIDGGAAIAARERAADLAAQAARSGANQITTQSLLAGPSDLQVDPIAAQAAGLRLLRAAGATGTITVTGPGTVRATAQVSRRTAILSMIGIGHVSGTSSSTAAVLHGVRTVSP